MSLLRALGTYSPTDYYTLIEMPLSELFILMGIRALNKVYTDAGL